MSLLHINGGSRESAASRLVALQQLNLQLHYLQCRVVRGAWFHTAAALERLHGAIAPRFVTTVCVAATLMLTATLW
jgi:hypothetical protein